MKRCPVKLPPSVYRNVLENFAIPCVDVVAARGKEFFLVKRKSEPAKGEWWLLGGRILKGETLVEAARRKMREEAGLQPLSLKQLFADETMFETSGFRVSTHTVNVVYLAKVKNKAVTLDKDHSDYKWFAKIDKRWHPYVKKALRSAGFK